MEANGQKRRSGQTCQQCSQGQQATHECVECQKVLCTPCHQKHKGEESSKSHTVLPLTGTKASLLAAGSRRCQKHENQVLLLFCCQCEVAICIVCKLTSHPDHSIEDLMDTGKKARAELAEELQSMTKREQVLRAFLTKTQDFQEDLAKERQGVEEKILDRAHELRQMVDRAQAEALETVGVTTEKALKELKELAGPVEERHAAADDKLQTVARIIRDGEDNEAVTTVARLKEEAGRGTKRGSENVRVERGTVRHEYRLRAVKYSNVLAFIGMAVEGPVLEARAAALGAEPLEVSVRPEPHPSAQPVPPVGRARQSQVGRSSPVEIHYSKNPKSTLAAMHLMSTDDDFWLQFNPGGNVSLFGLFDDDGYMKEVHSEDLPSAPVLVGCDGDTVLSMTNGRWVRPGKESGVVENFTNWGGTAVSKSSTPYLFKGNGIFRQLSENLPPEIDQTPAYTTTVFGARFDVSGNGQFVATIVEDKTVKVFDKIQASAELRSYADYVDKNGGTLDDVCFCRTDGKEVLLVASGAGNSVHVVDHKDGCCFVRALDSDKHPVTCPRRLATNHHGRVWVGCDGGKVVIFDV